MNELRHKKVAILVDDYFEEAEFTGPIEALKEAGATVDIIAANGGKVHGMHHAEMGETFDSDMSLDEARMEDYDALVLPGGAVNADSLRMNQKARDWINQFMDRRVPIAAICHAPWALASAGVAKGRKMTSFFTIQDDLRNAGADWSDRAVVIDKNLITSRKPEDLPVFNAALISMLQTA